MSEFKVGDTLECIDVAGYLTDPLGNVRLRKGLLKTANIVVESVNPHNYVTIKGTKYAIPYGSWDFFRVKEVPKIAPKFITNIFPYHGECIADFTKVLGELKSANCEILSSNMFSTSSLENGSIKYEYAIVYIGDYNAQLK